MTCFLKAGRSNLEKVSKLWRADPLGVGAQGLARESFLPFQNPLVSCLLGDSIPYLPVTFPWKCWNWDR